MTTIALRREAFTTNEQYLEAAHDLAQQKRQALAQLLAEGTDLDLTLAFASVVLADWNVQHDALWDRRLVGAQQ